MAGSFASLRFARSVFVELVERSGGNLVDQSRLTVVAPGATSPAVLITILLAVAVSGFFIAFYIPDVRIP